jgi:hypothetical protein
MPTFVVNPKDLGKDLSDEYADMIASTIDTIQTTVALHGPRLAQTVVSSLSPQPVDRGTYRRSFKVSKVAGGAVLYNFAPHAAVIEEGRRPGARMPPVDVILAWVKRKGIGATFTGPLRRTVRVYAANRKGRAKAPNERKLVIDSQQRHIALQIARKIGARGLPARHVLALTEDLLTPIVERAVDRALAKE